jgi:hypothetical protein
VQTRPHGLRDGAGVLVDRIQIPRRGAGKDSLFEPREDFESLEASRSGTGPPTGQAFVLKTPSTPSFKKAPLRRFQAETLTALWLHSTPYRVVSASRHFQYGPESVEYVALMMISFKAS